MKPISRPFQQKPKFFWARQEWPPDTVVDYYPQRAMVDATHITTTHRRDCRSKSLQRLSRVEAATRPKSCGFSSYQRQPPTTAAGNTSRGSRWQQLPEAVGTVEATTTNNSHQPEKPVEASATRSRSPRQLWPMEAIAMNNGTEGRQQPTRTLSWGHLRYQAEHPCPRGAQPTPICGNREQPIWVPLVATTPLAVVVFGWCYHGWMLVRVATIAGFNFWWLLPRAATFGGRC